jgi:hypothetical protein
MIKDIYYIYNKYSRPPARKWVNVDPGDSDVLLNTKHHPWRITARGAGVMQLEAPPEHEYFERILRDCPSFLETAERLWRKGKESSLLDGEEEEEKEEVVSPVRRFLDLLDKTSLTPEQKKNLIPPSPSNNIQLLFENKMYKELPGFRNEYKKLVADKLLEGGERVPKKRQKLQPAPPPEDEFETFVRQYFEGKLIAYGFRN